LRANDALSGLVLVVLALAMIAITTSFPAFPGQKYGPSLFPRILGTGIIICGILLIWFGLSARRQGAAWIAIAPWVFEPWRLGSFVMVLLSLVAYILLADTVGFIPIAFVLLLAMFVWLGVKPLHALIVAAVATIAIHWFFSTMLRVPLPRGWLDSVL
jgi:putative tricarboxylic transport membrane protein